MRGMEILESRYLFNAGAVDPHFGTGGSTTTALGAEGNFGSGPIIAQKNGKFLAIGYGSSNGAPQADLLRYNANGSLDTTFGSGGTAVIETASDSVKGIAVAPDGSIYVAVLTSNSLSQPLTSHIYRFTSGGQLDTTFASGGVETLGANTYLDAISVGRNGTLMVASDRETDPGGVVVLGVVPTELVVQAFNSDGSADAQFGTAGETDTQLGAEDVPSAIVIQRDGKAIVAGTISDGLAGPATPFVARYNTNGTLDSTYAKAGSFTSGNVFPQSIALTSSGKLLLSGTTSQNQIAVERLTSRGRIDSGFGTRGVALLQTNEQLVNTTTSIAVDPAGKIIVGAECSLAENGPEIILTGFQSGGNLDKHFGDRGTVSAAFDNPGALTGLAVGDHDIVTAQDMNVGTVNTVKELVIVAYKD